MRRAFTTAAALVLPIALAGGTAAATPQGAPASLAAQVLPDRQGPTDVCDHTDKRPDLRVGSDGRAVRQAQCYLNEAIDADLAEDGDYGPETRNAVRAFQQCAEIVVDGFIGAQTWSFLSFWANDRDAPFC